MFQKKADQTFEGLPGVVAIAYTVVFGKTEVEHDEYLDNVMKRTQEVDLCQDKSVVKCNIGNVCSDEHCLWINMFKIQILWKLNNS